MWKPSFNKMGFNVPTSSSTILMSRANLDHCFKLGSSSGGHFGSVNSMKFIQGRLGTMLISVDSLGQMRIWEIEKPKQKPIAKITAHNESINCIATINNSILTASDDKKLKLWDLNHPSNSDTPISLVQTFENHTSYVMSCCVDSSQRLFASVSLDSSIRIWNPSYKEHVFMFRTESPRTSVSFLPGQIHMVLTSGSGGVQLWDIRNHSSYVEIFNNESHTSTTEPSIWDNLSSSQDSSTSTVFSRGSSTLSNQSNNDDDLMWESAWGQRTTSILSSDSSQSSQNENVSKGDSPTIEFKSPYLKPGTSSKIFDKVTQKYVKSFSGHNPLGKVYSVIISSDGRHMISSCNDGEHKLWDVFNQQGKVTFSGACLDSTPVPCLSTDNKILISGSSTGHIHFWKTHSHQEEFFVDNSNSLLNIKLHNQPITSTTLNNDGTILASGDESGSIFILSSDELIVSKKKDDEKFEL
eukprot:TRINITY_DN6970_c0_g1_i1.p1 TRINITY_DN6970_c0_g1~~TRINITY_DN6970_c0_g1_i1.p1  ORF type:complete len:468 (-),score=75.87 TRINITY_DN6970_c0_g1_i1:47-1450(-)